MKNIIYPIIQSNDIASVTEDLLRMPDGVGIYTRISVPKGKDKYPIVFDRTPYAEALNGTPYDINRLYTNLFIQRGYAIVSQHCRGSGDSEGEMIPYVNEKADGLAALEYIRTLPFYNGEIYVIGKSYLASTHLLYLSEEPKDIKGACIQIQTDRMYPALYNNGCCRCTFDWTAARMKRQFPNQNPITNELPYIETAKRVLGVDAPNYTRKLIHNTYDESWKNDPRENVIDTLKIPTLLVDGWYDFYIGGMTDMWNRMPETTKKKSTMIIGPYGHSTSVTKGAEYPFPNGNIPDSYDVDWFDSIRNNSTYPHSELGKITYYSICADKWKSSFYPQKTDKYKKLYFSKDKMLLKSAGDNEAISYVYDPKNSKDPHKHYNIFKIYEPNSIDGIISYISDPAEYEQSFFGKVRFKVNISSDCEDTSFLLKLCFVENGESYNITEALFSLSHFIPDYKPQDIVSIEVETTPIAFTLKKDVRLRVDISSVIGEGFFPHTNVRGHFAYVTETRIANNTFHTNGSYIELPYENL